MVTHDKSIEVDVPVRTAYDQWTQFESFPRFMEGVESVRQIDDKRLHWRAKIGGKSVEWDAEIYEQEPDDRIAWRSISGAKNFGQVRFVPLSPSRTKITLAIGYEPEGLTQNTGAALGVVSARIGGDLERFKRFIEDRQVPTGAWRGEIHGGEVSPETRA